MEQQQQLPAWNNTAEYASLSAAEFVQDFKQVEQGVRELESFNSQWAKNLSDPTSAHAGDTDFIKALQKISLTAEQTSIFIHNLSTFVNCEMAVDSKNVSAQKVYSQIQKVAATLAAAQKPRSLFLSRCDDSVLKMYLDSAHTSAAAFFLREERRKKDLLLTQEEEKTLAQFRTYGLQGWGDLYDQVSGSLKVKTSSKGEVGLAQAMGYLRGEDANLRREAWLGIQESWKVFEDPCAAILNNLSGYRLEEYKKRSSLKTIDFLEYPLMESKIERATLDAMMGAIASRNDIIQKALKLLAKCFGKEVLDPWDLNAPSPRTTSGQNYSFEKAIDLIAEAYAGISPEMGSFVRMMVKNNWIEARVLPNKRSGAYCTEFPKSRTPRVFQTYMESYQEVSTLAHELGHAWHSWVMRDMPQIQTEYPMTLAETASIFGETVLAEKIQETADAETRFAIAWAEVSDAIVLLANIPARFEFEKNFYTARENGQLSPEELSELTDQAYRKWYGAGLSQTERQFWMTKLHFSIADVSFYNYPYAFGYLFSLGIYARREKLGDLFSQKYIDILRDTGRMTAEELIQKHLGEDIRKPEFWLESLKVVESKVNKFEKLLANEG